MIVTSRRIIRNAQSGAAGNQTIWVTALIETKKIAAQRAHRPGEEAEAGDRDDRAEDQVDPAPGRDVGDDHSLTADEDDFVVEDAARPQRASSEPTINIRAPAKTVQPVGCLFCDSVASRRLLLSMVLLSLVDGRGKTPGLVRSQRHNACTAAEAVNTARGIHRSFPVLGRTP